jgi:hypothetical protein
MNLPYLLEAALMAIVLLFSVIVHEVAHGYVALLNGDPTAKMLGRITLNPAPHNPIGTIILPLCSDLPCRYPLWLPNGVNLNYATSLGSFAEPPDP